MRLPSPISVPHLAAHAAGVLATLAFAGWLFHFPLLTTVVPGLVSMKANTALSFMLLAASLHLAAAERLRRTQLLLALMTALLALATLGEYLFKTDIGIDEALARDTVSSLYPGRMAPITAINFVLLALSFLPFNFQWSERLSETFALAAGFISTFAIVGYLYGVPFLYGAISYSTTPMALHTGVSSLLLAIGFLFIKRESAFTRIFRGTSIASMVARRLVPVAVLVPIILGAIFIRSQVQPGRFHFAMALSVVSNVLLLVSAIWGFSLMIQRSEGEKETVQHQARTDQLTGIFNRRYFELVLDHEIQRAKRYLTPLALILFDIDHFKELNDRHGHLAGDRVLVSLVRRCEPNLRSSDSFCRYGGEEFAIIAPGTSADAALLLAGRIRKSVVDMRVEGVKEQVTISSGVAVLDSGFLKNDDIVAAADRALYEAKNSGRNRECLYSRETRRESIQA